MFEDVTLDDVHLTADRSRLRTDVPDAITLDDVEINGQPYALPNN